MLKSYVELKKEIHKLSEKSRTAACIELVGIMNEIMAEHKIRPILTGGLAVEIYTRCGYYFEEIDLMVQKGGLLKSVLDKLGFENVSPYWYIKETDAGLEILDVEPEISQERLSHIKLNSGREIYVLGFEDLILSRLKCYYQYRNNSDYDWAYRIYKIHRDDIDIDYLLEKAMNLDKGALPMISKW